MSEPEKKFEGKIYLLRHGAYDDVGFARLNDGGRSQIRGRAEAIKTDSGSIVSYDTQLYSSGVPRALESILEIGTVLGLGHQRIIVDNSLYGDMDSNMVEFFEIVKKRNAPLNIAVGHLDMFDSFPRWFANIYCPGASLKEFYNGFNNSYAVALRFDFKNCEMVDLTSRIKVMPLPIVKPEPVAPKPIIISSPTIPSQTNSQNPPQKRISRKKPVQETPSLFDYVRPTEATPDDGDENLPF